MTRETIFVGIFLAAAAALPLTGQPQPAGTTTSCITCHGDADLFDKATLEIVEHFRKDVHAEVGLSCQDCHGGNPAPETAEDPELAMDENFAQHPYVGAPDREAIPAFCGRCHSDPEMMKRYNPEIRIDQEQSYWTSQHGMLLRQGNTRVATCTDCHGVHGILRANDPGSSVYPTQVAETCRTCHADREHMAGLTLPNGQPIPTDQYALWRGSVHAAALLDRGDLSAPTCNDCHGNHGAVPPGVESVAFVCGQCHGREARLFRASRKHEGLLQHNEYLQDAGAEGCRACHEPPEPQAALSAVPSIAECVICHSNHGVARATVAILSGLPETPCAFCHEGAAQALVNDVPEPGKNQRRYEQAKANLMAMAQAEGVTGSSNVFNFLVDRIPELPAHTFPPDDEAGGKPRLRPEVQRLFEKFRIGKSSYTYVDPETGAEVRTEIYSCDRCHAVDGTSSSGGPNGLETAQQILEKMQELTALTARAERIMLTAHRGGVETRDAVAEIDKAVDAQIGLEVLVHTFETGKGSDFANKQQEGVEAARAALAAGRKALDELRFRRWWLAVFLALTLVVTVGLALKIREISRREARSGN